MPLATHTGLMDFLALSVTLIRLIRVVPHTVHFLGVCFPYFLAAVSASRLSGITCFPPTPGVCSLAWGSSPAALSTWEREPSKLCRGNKMYAIKKKINGIAKKKAYSTEYSQAVTRPSTNSARCCLASVIRRELVFSTWYGRRHNVGSKNGNRLWVFVTWVGGEQKARKAYSTEYSQAVTRPSTNSARCCLASVIRRELVFSTWCGRRQLAGPETCNWLWVSVTWEKN